MGVGKWVFTGLAVGIVGLITLGPYEPVDYDVSFDPAEFDDGVQAYFDRVEAAFDDIRPDSAKRVIWAGAPETRTPVSIVYMHGFSASSQEIRPVPDTLAQALGANLIYTRFAGHGRTSDAMAEGTMQAWMQDAAEAMAAARAVGDEVIIISTSTGGTIAALVLLDDALSADVKGAIFVSPNFGINNPMSPLLTMPAARYWVPLIGGKRRSFEPLNDAQAREWTTEYPSAAVFPMAAMVKHANAQDYAAVQVPALFYYSDDDQVVRPDLTHGVVAEWGGPATRIAPLLTEADTPFAHVVAGDITAPAQTAPATQAMLDWINGLK
ncbi:MAG: alpha/beta hydrolase [Roseovarius sp.]